MDSVLIKVSTFAFIILAGVVTGRSGKLDRRTGETLSQIVFSFTLPAAIVHAFGATEFDASLVQLVAVGLAFTAIPYAFIYVATHHASETDRQLYLLNGIGFNIGSFGLAFVQAFFPTSAVVAACMFDAGNALMVTGGQYAITCALLGHGQTEHPIRRIVRRLFASVPFDLYLILIALGLVGIQIPAPVITFLEPVANANAFLSMFMLGLMVRPSLNREKAGKALRLLGARLAMSAVMCAIALAALPFELQVRYVVATLAWAPIGSLGPVFTLWIGGDHGLAGLINTLSIVIGIVAMTACVVLTGSVG